MKWAYRALLRLYPRNHRTWFALEMQSVFEEAAREHRNRGRAAYLRFAVAELIGLIAGSSATWGSKLAGSAFVHDHGLNRRADVTPLPDEVREAEDRVSVNLNGLLNAISHHQFLKARKYAAEEQKARENLRLLRDKYNIGESGEPI